MFDFFRKHTWLLQVILAFVVIAFIGGGVYQGYGSFMADDNATVAKVDGRKITRTEWEFEQRQQIERIRRQMPTIDAKMFDTPQMRLESLEAVVRERVLQTAADKLQLVTPDARLKRLFTTEPQFAFLRNPDGSVKVSLFADGVHPSHAGYEVLADRIHGEITSLLN